MRKKSKNKFTRFTALSICTIMIISIITSRLVYLQIIKSDEYEQRADSNYIRNISQSAPRGNILDKNGSLIATNKQSFNLIYMQTDESKKSFFKTMEEIFKILDKNGEKQKDDFPLQINPFRFDFKAEKLEDRNWMELRFKKDRGLEEPIKQKFLKKIDKQEEKLTEEEKKRLNKTVDDELLTMTPEQTFNDLVNKYLLEPYKIKNLSKRDKENKQLVEENKKILEKVKGMTNEEKRRYVVIKDSLQMQSYSGYKPIVIAQDIKRETAFKFLERLNELPGVDVIIQPVRNYPYGELASSTLGYISKINPVYKEKYEEKGYDTSTDYVGISGIEAAFEERLKGSKGEQTVKVNKLGRIVEELFKKPPYPGQTIQLTIDKNIQHAAEVSLDQTFKILQASGTQGDVMTKNANRGAAVVVDLKAGKILAMASRPGFDPNVFSDPGGLTKELYDEYFHSDLKSKAKAKGYTDDQIEQFFPLDKSIKNNKTIRKDMYDILPKPLLNYANMALIPPGSTFKIITGIAGLETGAITPSFSLVDNGVFNDNNGFEKSFYGGANGLVNLYSAIQRSSNPYFMEVGRQIRKQGGDDLLAKYAWELGLGIPPNSKEKPSTGIEIPELFGQVYNTYSAKNIYSRQFLWQAMDMLKKGNNVYSNTGFIPVDLYDNQNDTEAVKKLKNDIKDEIKNSVKDSKFNENKIKELLTNLLKEDNKYKGKEVSNKEIEKIINPLRQLIYFDANTIVNGAYNIYNASIGQGISSFTCLQMVNAVATIANGGNKYKLHVLDKVLDPEGKVIDEVKPEILHKANISKQSIEEIKKGMYMVNNEPGGTAYNVFGGFPIKTAGKTGSATFSQNQQDMGRTSYGIYVGFAPYDDPQIAVCVVVFDGGHGGYVADVAKAIYEVYFKNELDKLGYKVNPSYFLENKEQNKNVKQEQNKDINSKNAND